MADNFPHKHIIGYVHITPDLTTDNKISTTDHSTYTLNSLFGVFAKNGRQAIDVCAETGTTYINGVDPVAAYAYSYNAIPQLENLINGKLNNYIKDHDVFHYGGILIPSDTKGQIGTFSYLVSDSMIIIGTSVKVQNDGWFGNYKVHAGDLLIAYDDAANTSSTNYWDILETHLGPLTSIGTYTNANSPIFLTNIHLNDNGELSYSYSYFTQVHSYVNGGEQIDNQVQKSLFMGDNNTTYMLSIDNGKIVIVQPIKSTSVSQGVTVSNTYSDGGAWLGASYDFSNYGLTVGTQQLIIQMGGTITTEIIKDINGSSSNYSVATNGDTFTVTLSGTNKQTISTTPSKLTGNFTNIGNIVFKDSISAKNYNVKIEIDSNNILSKTLSLPAQTKQQTVSVKANVYRCIGNPTSSNVSASAVSSKPTSVTFSSGGDIKYIFPEVFGTPTFKQLNSPDSNWELKNTYSYSSSSFSGTTNKVNYKVYGVKNATASGGTWQISW